MTPMLTAALWHASEGRAVFPCAPRGKHPLVEGGFHAATTDEVQIGAWWRATPAANLALPCDSFVVLDVDKKPKANGAASLAALLKEHGPLPSTWHATTPSGGEHFYFYVPTGVRVQRSIGVRPGIDLLGRGGYVLASPSVTEAGAYQFDDGGEPMALAPQWVAELARQEEAPSPEHAPIGTWGPTMHGLESRIRRACAYVGTKEPAISGARGHDALWNATCDVVVGFNLPEEIATEILRAYSQTCQPPWSDRELKHKIKQAASRSARRPGYLLNREQS